MATRPSSTWLAAIFAKKAAAKRQAAKDEAEAKADAAGKPGGAPGGDKAKSGGDAAKPPAAPAPKRPLESNVTILALLVIIVGLLAVGLALAQPTKAALGQYLIARAFDDARAAARDGGRPVDAAAPWSWADMRPVAKLRFPSLGGAERVVLDTASGEAMAWAPGHVRGTAALGAPGVTAIAAHRDTHFALLQRLAPGAEVTLETVDGAARRYRVTFAQVVDARRFTFSARRDGPDVLALSTCWPIGSDASSPQRLVIYAVRSGAAPEA